MFLLRFAASRCLCVRVELGQAAVEENLGQPGDGRCRGNGGMKKESKPQTSVCQSTLNAVSWTSINSTTSSGPQRSTHISLIDSLTVQLAHEPGPPLLREVNGYIVDRSPRQSDADADQRVDGVSVQRDDDQEEAAQAVDEREEEGQLWGEESSSALASSQKHPDSHRKYYSDY